MNNKTILAVLIGLIIGIGGTLGVSAMTDKNDRKTVTTIQSTSSNDHSTMSMADMTSALTGKTGDTFDKAFISEMIAHHQGAIDMAKLAQTNAKHDEIKTLAGKIITAQTTEISQMQGWQTQWNYVTGSSTNSMPGMDHMSH